MRAILAAIMGALKAFAWLFETAVNTVICAPRLLWESMVRAAGGGRVADADEPQQAADHAVSAAQSAAIKAAATEKGASHFMNLAADLQSALVDRLEGLPISAGKLDDRVIDYIKKLSPGEANILAHTDIAQLAGYLRGDVLRIPGVRLPAELSPQPGSSADTKKPAERDSRLADRVSAYRSRRAVVTDDELEAELAY